MEHRLSAENLAISSSQAANQLSQSVQRFVDEQQRYARQYAKEGAIEASKWNEDIMKHRSQSSKAKHPLKSSAKGTTMMLPPSTLAVMPSSPLLQPRVPLAPEDTSLLSSAKPNALKMDRSPHEDVQPRAARYNQLQKSSKSAIADHSAQRELYLDEHQARKSNISP
ncbi:hypothetical protein DL93DRAFT_407818 [Clavulina sp. PMI_390]|nr:hypothetical protein DL93DRAFT_407818 [Clavulina sp. PMI_390]